MIRLTKAFINEKGEIVSSPRPPKKNTSTLPDDIPRKISPGVRVIRMSLTPRTRVAKDLSTNGHWEFDEPLGNGFGFIYLIHDRINDRMYIGKKQYVGAGKLNKGVESDWKKYTSSCKALQASIKANGKEMFKFYVLEQYRVRGTLGYAETWSLMQAETPANRDKWYNLLVNKISWNVKEGITEKHKRRLKAILNNEVLELYND